MEHRMLSPPQFEADLSSSSLLDEKNFDVIPSEQIPCSPQSYSTSFKGLFQLLQQGRQIAPGLKKLQQLLDKINLNRNMIATVDRTYSECSYWRLEFTCLYNMSYAFTLMDNDDEILKYNQKIIQLMDRVEKQGKQYQENQYAKLDNYNISSSALIHNKAAFLNQGSTQYSHQTKFFTDNNIKLDTLFIRVLLYSCFKLSRVDEHQQAFLQARRAKNMITKIIQSLEVDNQIENSRKHINEKIEFKQIIGKKAHPIIKQLKKDLKINDVEKSQSLKMIKSTISCWKRNPEHSKKDLKANRSNCYTNYQNTKIETGEERSLLGVRSMKSITSSIYASRLKKKSPQCIKDILCLEPVNFKQLCRGDNIVYEVIPEKLKQKIQLLCASYFCMGIQLWNIETESQEQMNSLASSRSLMQVQVKNSKEHATSQQIYKKSELYLLKAIGITVSYLKQYQNLLDNLVEVYQRKFQGEMMSITQQNSRFQMSPCPSSQLKRDTKNRLSHKLLEQERQRQKQRQKQLFENNSIKATMLRKQAPSTADTLQIYDQYQFQHSIMGPEQVYYKLGNDQSEEDEDERFYKTSKMQSKETNRSRSKSKSKGKIKAVSTLQSHATINFSCKGKTRSRRKNIQKRQLANPQIGSRQEYQPNQYSYSHTANIHPNLHHSANNLHSEVRCSQKGSKNKNSDDPEQQLRKYKKKSLQTSKSKKKNITKYKRSDESSLNHSTLERYRKCQNPTLIVVTKEESLKTLSNKNSSPKHKIYELKKEKSPQNHSQKVKIKSSHKKIASNINTKEQKSMERSNDAYKKVDKIQCSYTNLKACWSRQRSFDKKDLSGNKKSSKKVIRNKKPLKNL